VLLGIDDTLQEDNLKDIFNIAKKYNAYVRINIYRPIDKSCKLIPPSFEAALNAIKFIEKNHKIISLSDPLFSSVLTSVPKKDPSAWNSLRILQNGEIYPSTYLINKEFLIGNIKDNTKISTLVNHAIIKKMITGSTPRECEACLVQQTCRGGTIDRRYIWYNTLNERDPYCPKRHGFDIPVENFIQHDKDFSSVHDGYLPTLFFKPGDKHE
jgi:radical SAM protein with 4Fe4S-binding SPASM domain